MRAQTAAMALTLRPSNISPSPNYCRPNAATLRFASSDRSM